MTPSELRSAAVSVFLCLASSCVCAQNLVNDGSFEQAVVPPPWIQRLAGETFGGWTVDTVGQGIVQVHTPVAPAADGVQFVELNFYQPGGISQAIGTVPGRTYRLSFQLAGQTDTGPSVKHMRIDWGGVTVTTVTWDLNASGGQWEPHTYLLTATAPTTVLHFLGLEEVDGGPFLDDVRLETACGTADIGIAGGVRGSDGLLNNNDFIAFITAFFAADPVADFGSAGGVQGADGTFDNNDFIAFITAFFEGCS